MLKLLVCFLILSKHYIQCRIGFKKDTSEIEFPPRYDRMYTSSIPTGHLRPLGWQRSPEGKIIEAEIKTSEEFNAKYVVKAVPVSLKQGVETAPAIQTWSNDDHIRQQYGELIMHVTVKKERTKLDKQKVKFKKFLREYEYEDWYLTNIMPREMMHEFTVPEIMRCGFIPNMQLSELWMSSGGTSSLLHSHSDHQIHCLVAGRKDFILIDPQYKTHLHFKQTGLFHEDDAVSEIDVSNINMFKYQKIAEIPWSWSTLRTGDCIFIPAKYLHQVRSYGRSVSWTVLWTPSLSYAFDKCIINNDRKTLLDFHFTWEYNKGEQHLRNPVLNATNLVHHLKLLMLDKNTLDDDVFKRFVQYYLLTYQNFSATNTELDNLWFSIAKDKHALTRQEVETMSESLLQNLCAKLAKSDKSKSFSSFNVKEEL